MSKDSKFKKALYDGATPYLIGEVACIHEGDFEYLTNLIDEIIKKKSCDAIKYHILIDLDSHMTKSHEGYELVTNLMLPKEKWASIIKKTKSRGFEVIVLVDDLKAVDFVREYIGLIDAVEVHAIALNNIEMLDKVKELQIPIILGIGGSEIDDIKFAINYLNRKDILLMHGFQNYPTKYEYINFNKMIRIRNKFNLPMGYADHTVWDNENNELITLAGFMAGANFIEKHIALEIGKERIDFNSAISIDMLSNIRKKMELLNKTKGDGSFEISKYEKIYSKNGPMKFTIVANRALKRGQIIKKEDITFRRTGEENTINQRDYLNLIGKKVKKDIPKMGLVNWRNIEK